jgi:hypothetical protein
MEAKHGQRRQQMLAFPLGRDKLKPAAAIYLVLKYQEGYVLGRQAIRKTNSIPFTGAPIHFEKIAAVFLFLVRCCFAPLLTGGPKMPDFDRRKSLQQLESQDWGEPNFHSHLVTECHRLRRVPLREFTAENLRIMIGQDIGLSYLVPLALELLSTDPLTEGDFYKGDLLQSLLRVYY